MMSSSTTDKTSPDATPHEARCHCGAVVLRLAAPPRRVLHCHCGQCRSLAGSAFTTWASYGREAVGFGGGEALSAFKPSAHGTRHFCRHCGTHVFSEDGRQPSVLGIPAGVLRGVRLVPEGHYFVSDKADWCPIPDGLPRFGGASGFEALA